MCKQMEVTWAFDVHEIGVWTLHKPFFLVSPPFLLGARVQQILCKLKKKKEKYIK